MVSQHPDDGDEPRYHWKVLPNRHRPAPRWHEWWRLVLVVVVLAGLVTGGPWLARHLPCTDGVPTSSSWSADGECVGFSSGPYTFGLNEFGPVMSTIADQNNSAGRLCPADATPMTIAVLASLTSPNSGGRALHEIEGMAAAQAAANGAGCVHPVKVKVANIGGDAQAAREIAERVKADFEVVAVAGLGLSDPRTAEAANVLGALPDAVPMVADLITAEGFDAVGSRGRDADFLKCAAHYPDGVGGGYLYRISHGNRMQIDELARFLAGRQPDFVVTPTDTGDPYTCTAVSAARRYGDPVEVKFDPNDEATVRQVAERICGTQEPINLFYTARSKDLSRFIQSIDTRFSNGMCQAKSITMLSTSDASRLRAMEPEPVDEQVRLAALDSRIVREGKLKVIYTPLADSDSLRRNGGEFNHLESSFVAAGFDPVHLDDGWAISAYDSLRAVVWATSTIGVKERVSRANVNTGVKNVSPGNAMAGASGTIAFDNNGNRTGDRPAAVLLCPNGARPYSVPATEQCAH